MNLIKKLTLVFMISSSVLALDGTVKCEVDSGDDKINGRVVLLDEKNNTSTLLTTKTELKFSLDGSGSDRIHIRITQLRNNGIDVFSLPISSSNISYFNVGGHNQSLNCRLLSSGYDEILEEFRGDNLKG